MNALHCGAKPLQYRKDVGLDQNSLFETDDLYESSDHDGGGNLGAVLYTLGVLARLAEKNKLP